MIYRIRQLLFVASSGSHEGNEDAIASKELLYSVLYCFEYREQAGDKASSTWVVIAGGFWERKSHGMGNEFALRSRTGVRASFLALTCA